MLFAYAKTKAHTPQLINAFVFATKIVKSLLKMPSLLQSSVAIQWGLWTDLVGNPEDGFSGDAHILTTKHDNDKVCTMY